MNSAPIIRSSQDLCSSQRLKNSLPCQFEECFGIKASPMPIIENASRNMNLPFPFWWNRIVPCSKMPIYLLSSSNSRRWAAPTGRSFASNNAEAWPNLKTWAWRSPWMSAIQPMFIRNPNNLLGRGWRFVLNKVYQKPVVPMGPLVFQKSKPNPQTLNLTFKHVGDGLKTTDGTQPLHFEVAGADRKFHPATATISGRDQVNLTSPKIQQPIHARYAWVPSPKPTVNLINSAGLPASPFTTEEEY